MALEESRAERRTADSTTRSVGLKRVAEGQFAPTDFAVEPGDADRRFVVDRPGLVHVLEDGPGEG